MTAPASSPRGLLELIYTLESVSSAERLAAIRSLRVLLDEEEAQLAFLMRLHQGATWAEIATAAGLHSGEAARRHFKGAEILDRLDVSRAHRPADELRS